MMFKIRWRATGRLGGLCTCVALLSLLWLASSNLWNTVPSQTSLAQVSLLTRAHTYVQPPVSLTHRHSNDTLRELARNMTVLRANQTHLRDIIAAVHNSSAVQATPLNPHPFKYLLNAPNVCKGKNIFLICYIHTAPAHYKRRMIIRQTWGDPRAYFDLNLRVVFIMGKSFSDTAVQDALAFEAETYGDIVQEDFLDSYKNLTYKGIAGLKWVSQNCGHAKFVLKSDDDIFVNTFTLLRHLKSLERQHAANKGLLMCLVWNRMKVMRTGKWAVSKQDFKDDYYPTYCSGSAYTMSSDVAAALHSVSYHVPFFWVDDFYITGLLPLKLGLKHKQFMSTYVLDGRQLESKFTGPQWYSYVFSHVHDLNKVQAVWQQLRALAHGDTAVHIKTANAGELNALAKAYDDAQAAKEAARKAKNKDAKKKSL